MSDDRGIFKTGYPRKVIFAKTIRLKLADHTLEIPQDIADGLSFYLSRSVFWDGVDCANIVAEEAKCGSILSTKAMEARTWMLNALREGKKYANTV